MGLQVLATSHSMCFQVTSEQLPQVWWWLDLPYKEGFAFLCGMVDVRRNDAEQAAIADDFWNTPSCCKDAWGSQKAQNQTMNLAVFHFRAWVVECFVSNLVLERSLQSVLDIACCQGLRFDRALDLTTGCRTLPLSRANAWRPGFSPVATYMGADYQNHEHERRAPASAHQEISHHTFETVLCRAHLWRRLADAMANKTQRGWRHRSQNYDSKCDVEARCAP